MTAATLRFLALLATLVAGLGAVLRMLWNAKTAWDGANAELKHIVKAFEDFVQDHDGDHNKVDVKADRIETRFNEHVERHRK